MPLCGTVAAKRIESLMQYTVKYGVNVRTYALYRLELSANVFAPIGWQTGSNSTTDRRIRRPIGEFGDRSASAWPALTLAGRRTTGLWTK